MVGAMLAHELQHVLEIDAADVRSGPAAAAFYKHHGRQVGANAFDTDAAVVAGIRTLHELTGRPMSWRMPPLFGYLAETPRDAGLPRCERAPGVRPEAPACGRDVSAFRW